MNNDGTQISNVKVTKDPTHARLLQGMNEDQQRDAMYYQSQFMSVPQDQRTALADGIRNYANGADPTVNMSDDQKQAYQFGKSVMAKSMLGQPLTDKDKQQIHGMNPQEKDAMLTGISYEGMQARHPEMAGKGLSEKQTKMLDSFEQTGQLNPNQPNNQFQPTAFDPQNPSQHQNGLGSGVAGAGGNSLTQPSQDGGVNVTVDGHNVHLTPGTSMTIGKDGQVTIQPSRSLDPTSTTASEFPGTAAGNETGLQTKDPQTSMGVVAGNLTPGATAQTDSYQLGSRVQKAGKLRDYYGGQKGMESTSANLGNQQQSSLESAVGDKSKTQSAGLNVNKDNEMTL